MPVPSTPVRAVISVQCGENVQCGGFSTGTACKTRTEEPDRSHRRRRISRVSEHLQRQLDAIILQEQLHSRRSAFHAHAYTDDDGGCAGSV